MTEDIGHSSKGWLNMSHPPTAYPVSYLYNQPNKLQTGPNLAWLWWSAVTLFYTVYIESLCPPNSPPSFLWQWRSPTSLDWWQSRSPRRPRAPRSNQCPQTFPRTHLKEENNMINFKKKCSSSNQQRYSIVSHQKCAYFWKQCFKIYCRRSWVRLF